MRYVIPRRETRPGRRDFGHWMWLRLGVCLRCQQLRNHHDLKLTELIGIWEAQDRRCYKCSAPLPDPRIVVSGVRGKGRAAKIDHDHKICPKKGHSCSECRRGLACNACNCHDLAIRTIGIFALPQGSELVQWLESIGPEERDRLRTGLTLFPEQPIGRPQRHRVRSEADVVVPLFDFG